MSFWRVLSGVWPPMLAALALSGCATHELWQGNAQYVQVLSRDGTDVETELKRSGLQYYCEEFAFSSYPGNKACYAERSRAELLKSFTVRMFKTPLAVAKDTGAVILVVGVAYLEAIARPAVKRTATQQ